MKDEVLNALDVIEISSDDGFDFEGDTWSSEDFSKEVETDNYWIDLDFSIYVTWINHQEYIYDSMDIERFKVWDKLGNEICTKTITNKEIEESITINV